MLKSTLAHRIEFVGWLIHENDVGIDGQCASQTQALLLLPRQIPSRARQLAHNVIPEIDFAQGLFDPHLHIVRWRHQASPKRHVVEDRHRKGIWAREEHADVTAYRHGVSARRVEVFTEQEHLPIDFGTFDEVVHAIERAQHRTLARARRADERHNPMRGDRHGDLVDHPVSGI